MTALLDRFVDRARAAGGRVGAMVVHTDGSEALSLDPDGISFSASVIKDGWGDDPDPVDNDAGVVRAGSSAVVVVGFTHKVPALVARPPLGLLGLAAAELAGARVDALPVEMAAGA